MIKCLYSMKTALLLMTAIVAISIFATFESNAQTYNSYLFKGLLIFLIINLTFCTIKRTANLWVKLRNKSFDELKKSFSSVPMYKIADMHSLRKKIVNTFHHKGYRIIQLQSNHELIIYLNKGTLSLIANQIVHYALIIVFIGAFVSTFGFNCIVSGGINQVTILPIKKADNSIKIKIDGFTTLHNPDRTVRNWETRLTIIDNETKGTKGRTRVNHPFRYRGVTVYQSGYQETYLIELNNNGTKERYFLPLNKMIPLSGRLFFIEKNEHQKYFVTVYEDHTLIKTYALTEGVVVNFPNHTALTFLGEKTVTILKVKKDPGTPIVIVGLTMLAIGFTLLYLGPYHEIIVLLDESNQTIQINIIFQSKVLNERLTNEVSNLVLGG